MLGSRRALSVCGVVEGERERYGEIGGRDGKGGGEMVDRGREKRGSSSHQHERAGERVRE